MNIVTNYQERLYNRVDKSTIDTFPRTLMLLGEFGCGKHTLVNYIANKFKFEVEDISDNITLELLDDISTRPIPKIYIIESDKLNTRNENVILKFLEEPMKNAYIILLVERKEYIIQTVVNRCQVWEFEGYPIGYLDTLIPESHPNRAELLLVANTPGKVQKYQSYPISDMIDLANRMFLNMCRANIANALTLGRHLAFKNEKDKFDFNLFCDILVITLHKLIMENKLEWYTDWFAVYSLTSELNHDKYIHNVDKKALFDKYIITLKKMVSVR